MSGEPNMNVEVSLFSTRVAKIAEGSEVWLFADTRETMKKKTDFTFTDLPSEIQIQILARIPLESLLTCGRVCKTWKNFMLDPSFIQVHQSLSPLTIIFVHSSYLKQCTTLGFINEIDGGSSRGFRYIDCYTDTAIVGSCNGLVCTSTSLTVTDDEGGHFTQLAVCNPILRSYFMLHYPPRPYNHEHYGFGYTPSTGQYKAIYIEYINNQDERRLLFHVCTIESGNKYKNAHCVSEWRPVSFHDVEASFGLPYLSNRFSNSVFFNGSIIWIAMSFDDIDTDLCHSLIYFDTEKETVQALLLPPTIFKNPLMNEFEEVVRIGVFYDEQGNDHLYLCEDQFVAYANIWVMEDCKCINSLKVKWVVHLPFEERRPLKLYKVLGDGKLLIGVQYSKLARYDPNTKALEIIMKSMVDSENGIPIRPWLAIDKPNLLGCLL